jgi:tRNA nucleotidyltransferase/poly(A) polymerase
LIKNVSQFDSQKSERQKRCIQRQEKQATTSMYEAQAAQLVIPMQHNDEDLVNEEDINDCLQNKADAVDGLLLLSQISKDVGIQVQEEELLNTRSVGIQCNGLDLKKDAELQVCTNEMLTVCDFIKTEKELSTATGLLCFYTPLLNC